jgi:hypothetical protein
MDLKKIKEKNPGVEFTSQVSKKASKEVLEKSLKTKLSIDLYRDKYADKKTSTEKSDLDVDEKEGTDKGWTFLKKVSKNKNTDFSEEPKASFFNEEGEEVASQG